MTARERVLASLRHEEPDMVPVDFGGMRSTGIHAIAYNRLKSYLDLTAGSTRVYDIMQQIALVEDEVRRRFRADVVPLEGPRSAYGLRNVGWQPYILPDGSTGEISRQYAPVVDAEGNKTLFDTAGHAVARMPVGAFWFDRTYFPLEEASTAQEIDRYDWESELLDESELAHLATEGKRLYTETEYAIMGSFGGSVFEWSHALRGYANAMADLAGDKVLAGYLLDRMTEVHLENLRRYLDAVGPYVQVVQVGDDLGMQSGPWLSRELYREMIKPRHRKIYQFVKERCPHCFVFLHSCGSIYDLLPELIDAGVDIVNPVQTSARGMDPARLKRDFGDRLTFWGGGVDTQHVLPRGTVEEVRAQVRERLEIFAPGGGFVFCQVHNVQAEVPPENVVAMFEAVNRYRMEHGAGNA